MTLHEITGETRVHAKLNADGIRLVRADLAWSGRNNVVGDDGTWVTSLREFVLTVGAPGSEHCQSLLAGPVHIELPC